MVAKSMFIANVLMYIWKHEASEYFDELEKNRNNSIDELYELCREDIFELNGGTCLETNLHMLTVFETIGCSHQFNEKTFGGCSFCDWDSNRIRQLARLKSLSQLDEEKYAKIIHLSFNLARGKKCNPRLIEQLSVHNIIDKKQFPEAAFKLMFENDFIYSKKPEIGIISARADYITVDSVIKWKNVFRKSLTIGIGVECGNEWIRNYWLNKNIINEQIVESVRIIKENDAKTCANILLGIPGLSENTSLAIFFDTLEFLLKEKDIDVDYILISPLINKKKTVGGFLTDSESTISYRLLLSAICGIQKWFPDYIKRITFSPDNLNKMMELSCGVEREKIKNLFEAVGQFGTVYTSNKYNFNVIKYKSEVLDVSCVESLLSDLINASEKIIDKIGCNRENMKKQLYEDLLYLNLEALNWERWKY